MKGTGKRWMVCVWVLALILTGCHKDTAPQSHTSADTTVTVTTTSEAITTESTTTETVTTEEATAVTTEPTAEKKCETTVATSTVPVTTAARKPTAVTPAATMTASKPTSVAQTTAATTAVTTAAPSTTMSTMTAPAIVMNHDDPWKYPMDVAACLADCKVFGESLRLQWDDSLTLGNASWAGDVNTYQSALHPDKWNDKTEVFGDIARCAREGRKRFCVLFIPNDTGTLDNVYNIFTVSM